MIDPQFAATYWSRGMVKLIFWLSERLVDLNNLKARKQISRYLCRMEDKIKQTLVNLSHLNHIRFLGFTHFEFKAVGPNKYLIRPRQFSANPILYENHQFQFFKSISGTEIEKLIENNWGSIFYGSEYPTGSYRQFWELY